MNAPRIFVCRRQPPTHDSVTGDRFFLAWPMEMAWAVQVQYADGGTYLSEALMTEGEARARADHLYRCYEMKHASTQAQKV